MLKNEEKDFFPEDMIFFDLEHYVYKKPKCIGVFGACIYNKTLRTLSVTQYMIENRYESIDILHLAEKYFKNMKENGKRVIVTFSGNNDFTVINYLFKKYGINYDFNEEYTSIDIQKEYDKAKKKSIGLKNLEKQFGIMRESELISGSNLAKTFHKVMKDREYISRMPKDKVLKILLYNEQDVVNLFHIFMQWNLHIDNDLVEEKELKEDETINEDNLEDIDNEEEIEKGAVELNN